MSGQPRTAAIPTGSASCHADDLLAALDVASPAATADVVAQFLAERVGATSTTLLLADYQQQALHPLPTNRSPAAISDAADGSVPMADSDAGSAYVHGTAVTRESAGGAVTYLPVGRRGDRLGVLAVLMPAVPDETLLGDLTRVATVIGYALDVAGRRADIYEQTRRTRPFSVAAEVQWHQLPARACTTPCYRLAGDLEPAYEVGGDSFDWSVSTSTLTVAITDAMGHALPAAMLSTLALAGLRQGRRAGADLTGQARVADQALLQRFHGEQFVTATLLQLDLNSGHLGLVRAGSPDLYHLHDGRARLVEMDSQLPLGMAEATDYREQSFGIVEGDRLVIVSDGVTESRNAAGDEFGDSGLTDVITSTADQPPVNVVSLIYRALHEFTGDRPLHDDATVFCLDWLTSERAGHQDHSTTPGADDRQE